MNQYFRDFYQNWTNKAAGITGNNLSDVYDKYMTLFVIFNNLHNQIPDKLISLRVALPNRIQDNKAATEMVIKFLGADDFLNLLRSNGLEDDITLIIQLIQQEAFHIKLNYGQYNRNDDLTILAELQSPINTQKKKKTIAKLKVIYHVRCNIFHGSKNFQEYQRILVEPLIRLIQVLNPLLFSRLNP